ncbi:unnamed protein product, partial [marine sediment metagenome]
VGRDFCYAALRLTPATRAGRSPRWIKSGNKWIPWHNKTAPKGIVRIKKAKPQTKAVWGGCLARLGKPSGKEGKFARKYSFVKLTHNQLVVSNNAPYIEDFDKGKNPTRHPLHIGERAMQKVMLTMNKRLDNMAKRVVRKTIGRVV